MTGLRNHGVSRIRLWLFSEPLAKLLQGKTQARQLEFLLSAHLTLKFRNCEVPRLTFLNTQTSLYHNLDVQQE